MPVTRTRSQRCIDFPAKKSRQSARSKASLAAVEEPINPSSRRKRTIKEDVLVHSPDLPTKIKKAKSSENNENIKAQSPVKPLTPVRQPLTPRKDNIPSTPGQSALTVLRSPGKENAQTSSMTVLSSPNRVLDFSPRTSERCPTPSQKSLPITKGRSLNFDSPVKSCRSSPRKSFGTPRPKVNAILSPLRLARQDGICYQRAKQALNTAMPQKLVCREEELSIVETFLESHLDTAKPGSLYISGAPGTGKTAVLTCTMETLKKAKRHLFYLNCMSLRNSQAIYNSILGNLKGQETSLSAKQAQAELEKSLSAKGSMVVLVLDEMDQLDSKNQEILYTIFEWPSLDQSRLILIGIANALDLTDRILPRLQARPKCRPQLLHFPPYSRDQIVQVLQERLKQVEVDGQMVLETTALKFCASKVAAIAGDMRKALDVCRRAIELVEADIRKQSVLDVSMCRSPTKRRPVIKKIGVPHILKIVNEVYGSRMVNQSGKSQTIPLQQKLTICSLLLLVKNGKTKEITVGKLHETYHKVCIKQNVARVDQSEFLSMCSLIDARGIITVKKAKDTRSSKISLKLDESELEIALQDKTLISSVLLSGL